ncbi:hypothetical protein [Variovorax sp. IB41]|uniref:hypothetical protein n=1 Tax=Variovorax sp. IB41 TaxID=2779370 RepID=UPI0018E89498|nr:hypothetical protein [Variovorax sp. IB41]MBJ2154609.1 hypothetical protein [Variovorax sp. IB41]
MSRIEGRLARTLLNKKTVVTRAVFWKIPHSSEKEDIRLKLGRYKKPEDFELDEEVELLAPKSELTLDQEEFQALLAFLSESYEPFRQGVKAFFLSTVLLTRRTPLRFARSSRSQTSASSSVLS